MWLTGNPYWKVDNPIWTRIQTIPLPVHVHKGESVNHKRVDQKRVMRKRVKVSFVVSHSPLSARSNEMSSVRIISVDPSCVRELTRVDWKPGQEDEKNGYVVKESEMEIQDSTLLEVQVMTTCVNEQGRLYSVYIDMDTSGDYHPSNDGCPWNDGCPSNVYFNDTCKEGNRKEWQDGKCDFAPVKNCITRPSRTTTSLLKGLTPQATLYPSRK